MGIGQIDTELATRLPLGPIAVQSWDLKSRLLAYLHHRFDASRSATTG